MLVPVVLIRTAKLEQVVAPQVGNVVTNHLIVTIPITRAGLLSVYVKGAESLGGVLAAHNLEPSTQAGRLRDISLPDPLPKVAQEAVMEVVRRIRSDVGGQTNRPHLGLRRILGQGSRHALRVAGEKTADVDLVSRGVRQFVEMVGCVEVPLGRKIVVQTASYELAGGWGVNVAHESLNIDAIAV